MEMETYASLLSKQRRCESRSFSQPIYLAKRWGLYLPPSFSPANSHSLPCSRAYAFRAPTPQQGDSHKLRLGRWIDGARLVSGSQSPIDENLRAGLGTHVHAHTHTCEWVHVSALIAGIWKFRHLFDQLLPFSYRETDVENKWRSYGSKRYKSRAQLFHMPHTLPLPRDCNLAKIMLANKNGKRHKRLVPHSPIPSLAVSVFIYLYINIFLPVAPAAHFKLIVRQLACGAFIQFSSYMYASRYAYVVYFIYKRIYRYIWHILILHIRSRDKLTCNSCQRGVSSGGHCKK